MKRLNIALLLLLAFGSSSAGKTFWTYLGTRCIEDCKVYWGEYKCKTIAKDGQIETMYCSPEENTDYWGRRCKGCEKHGYDYYWCQIDLFQWGYCGLVSIENNHYGSQTGALCSSECGKSSKGYYHCVVEDGLDYCSPDENTDYMNRQCKVDSSCGKHNNDYKWCAVEGGWGYCGLTEPKMFHHRTHKNDVCINECRYSKSKNYYWCDTVNSREYCSPEVDVTYRGIPCHPDHSCGLHGKSYNWCWTSETKRGYCGPIEPAECSYVTDTHLSSRTPENNLKEIVACKTTKRLTTTISVEPASRFIADGSAFRQDVEFLIKQWHNGYLLDEARSNLIHSPIVRIDIKSPVNLNNQRYYNLQVLVNIPGKTPRSIILSQVLVPQGVPARYIRKAFLEGLKLRGRIIIDVTKNQV
ncbi:uncharacterized protein LOC130217680 [Danio aesculapii]|uniref:uncharacterized protein LOC130217680 n=1 Tax=Danio aesculapii TaxID=1142201 RepID=UPI0024C0D246|nr:uncharacterized protein LOC130217680 [Danio aesculapii]XP_056305829.1 uncharacterized protein LOC130217680 [Danio aesculapii]